MRKRVRLANVITRNRNAIKVESRTLSDTEILLRSAGGALIKSNVKLCALVPSRVVIADSAKHMVRCREADQIRTYLPMLVRNAAL